MTYYYRCEECGTVVDHEQPMGEDLPKSKKCPSCGKMTAKYDFNQVLDNPIHIPENMKAGYEGFKYNKMPREHKRFH